MTSIKSQLSRVEGKLDIVLGVVSGIQEDTAKTIDRVTSLEKSRSRAFGWIAGAGAVISAVFSYKGT